MRKNLLQIITRCGVESPSWAELQDRLGALFDSPIDELALEIAAEVRRQQRDEISPSERRKLVSEAARRLRRQIAEEGFSRMSESVRDEG